LLKKQRGVIYVSSSRGIRTKENIVEKLTERHLKMLDKKWLKLVDILKKNLSELEAELADIDIDLRIWCNSVCIEYRIDSEKMPVLPAGTLSKIENLTNELRKLRKIFKNDVRKIHEWYSNALKALLKDEEIPEFPQLEFPKLVDELKRKGGLM